MTMFCDPHWQRVQADVGERCPSREAATAMVLDHVGFDGADKEACPVCMSIARATARIEDHWVQCVAIAILSRTEAPP